MGTRTLHQNQNPMKIKTGIYLLIAFVLLILVVGFLYVEGYIDTRWQYLVIIFSAIAIPYKYLKNKLSGFDATYREIQNLKENQSARKTESAKYDETIEKKIQTQLMRLELIEEKLRAIDLKIENINLKKEHISEKVHSMDLDTLQNEFEKNYKRDKS
jgi:hypothetical protein